MPSQEFYREVLPQGKLTDDQWRKLIEWRELELSHLMGRYTPGTLGRVRLSPDDKDCCLQCMATAGAPNQFAEGYSLETQGIFRILKTPDIIRLGEHCSFWDRLQHPFFLCGFTRSRKWIVAEARLGHTCFRYELKGLKVFETTVDRLIEEYAIDRRTIWEFLTKSFLEVYDRKVEELEALRRQAEQLKGEQEFILALYGHVPFPLF